MGRDSQARIGLYNANHAEPDKYLTMMFQDNKEVLYRDGCCHFNTKGYDYIIDEIVALIKTDSLNAQ